MNWDEASTVHKVTFVIMSAGGGFLGWGVWSNDWSMAVVGFTVLILGALATIGGHGR